MSNCQILVIIRVYSIIICTATITTQAITTQVIVIQATTIHTHKAATPTTQAARITS